MGRNNKHLMTGHEVTVSRVCYIAGNFEAENSLNLAVTEVISQHSRVTLHCYPRTSFFAILPSQRFWRETVSLLDVM